MSATDGASSRCRQAAYCLNSASVSKYLSISTPEVGCTIEGPADTRLTSVR